MSSQRAAVSTGRSRKEHVRQRALERYGVIMTNNLSRLIVERIQGGKSVAVKDARYPVSNHRGVYDVDIEGIVFRVVWHRLHKQLITVLPPPSVGGTP